MRNTHAEHYESALPLIADIPGEMAFRCEGPFSDSCTATRPRYSITRSALASTVGGMVRSSAAAVLRLRINSNLVGNCAGRSSGFSPRKILAAYVTVSRHLSLRTGAYEICLLPQ